MRLGLGVLGYWGLAADGTLYSPAGRRIGRLPIRVASWFQGQMHRFALWRIRPQLQREE